MRSTAFVKSLFICFVLSVFLGVCCLCVPICVGQAERCPRLPYITVLTEKFQRLVWAGGKRTNIAPNALFIICVCLTAHSVISKRGQPTENTKYMKKLGQKFALKWLDNSTFTFSFYSWHTPTYSTIHKLTTVKFNDISTSVSKGVY